MDSKQKLTAVSLAALATVIAFLKWRGHPSVAAPAAGTDPFLTPYELPTPGISDDPITLNGGAPFQSTVNVSVNPSYLGTLSQTYIPMFGFVGGGVAPPTLQDVTAPRQLTAPPPQPTYFATPTPPKLSPPVYEQPSPFAPAPVPHHLQWGAAASSGPQLAILPRY